MKNKKYFDFLNRNKFKQFEYKRVVLKIILKNSLISNKLRWFVNYKLFNLRTMGSITRIKNRCMFTGRCRFVFKKLRLSRHATKLLLSSSSLINYNKITW